MEEKLNKWCKRGGGGGGGLSFNSGSNIGSCDIEVLCVSFWLEHFQTQPPGFENEPQGRKLLFSWFTVFTLRNKKSCLFVLETYFILREAL